MAERDYDGNKRAFGIAYDPTINAGHILTTAALLVSLIVWGTRLESRVDHESDLRVRIEREMEANGIRDRATVVEIKAYMQRMEDKIDRIQQSVTR